LWAREPLCILCPSKDLPLFPINATDLLIHASKSFSVCWLPFNITLSSLYLGNNYFRISPTRSQFYQAWGPELKHQYHQQKNKEIKLDLNTYGVLSIYPGRFFWVVVLGVDRGLTLVDRNSTTWAMPPALFALAIFETGSCFLPGLSYLYSPT
jgi:hypothetical protein